MLFVVFVVVGFFFCPLSGFEGLWVEGVASVENESPLRQIVFVLGL